MKVKGFSSSWSGLFFMVEALFQMSGALFEIIIGYFLITPDTFRDLGDAF